MKLDAAAARRAIAEQSPSRSASTSPTPPTASCASPSPTMSYAVKGVTTERGLDAGALRADRLWRRRAAARLADRARDRHVARHHPARAGPLLRLRHAALGPALRLRAHLVHAARGRRPSTRSSAIYARARCAGQDSARRRAACRSQRSRVALCGRHALRRPGAPGHGGPARAVFEQARPRRASSSTSTRCTRCATAPARRRSAAEIVSLRATVTGVMKKPPLERDRARAARARRRGASAASAASISAARQLDDTPAYARDALLAGNGIAGPALIEEHASTTVLLPGDRAAGRRVRQPRDRRRERNAMKRKAARPTRVTRPRSCATACSPSPRR